MEYYEIVILILGWASFMYYLTIILPKRSGPNS